MRENVILEKSFAFSVRAVRAYQHLASEKKEYVLSKQFLRSATSIGANVHEANNAQSKKDFISKLEIALKESNETSYWLKLLYKTGRIDQQTYYVTERLCGNIRRLLIASCRTAKQNYH